MKKQIFPFLFLSLILMVVLNASSMAQTTIPVPEDHFGFKPCTDRMLFDYEELISYFKKVDEASDQLKMIKIGESPMKRDMYVAFISSSENIHNLDELRTINKKLALQSDLDDLEISNLIDKGKVFVLLTLSMHSTEVTPAQASPTIIYELLTKSEFADFLEDVVVMIVPNHNPDGMDMVVNHYKKYKDTKYEGSSMPGLYHKYVGHDNNRDFVILSQDDTKAIARLYNTEWFPQVMVEKHQMGSTGARYFISPPHDPIAENVDAGVYNWMKVFGSRAVTEMTEEGLKGVTHSYLFDDYWPGATETCIWKGVIGMLTELASTRTATPIYIEPNELGVYGKGISEYEKGINMTDPWPGGWWRLSDMLDYERYSTYSLIRTASHFKDDILKFRNEVTKREVKRGKTEAPYYYIYPAMQHDKSELVNLVNLLNEHGVSVYQLNRDIILDKKNYLKGDIVVPLAQPYRAFIKEVLEAQKFPERHYTPGGEMIQPYDITSWSLTLHKGLEVTEVSQYVDLEDKIEPVTLPYTLKKERNEDVKFVGLSATNNDTYKSLFYALKEKMKVERLMKDEKINGKTLVAGSFIIKVDNHANGLLSQLVTQPLLLEDMPDITTQSLEMPKIALIETWFHDMDAGWTRFVFDSYNISYTLLRPDEIEKHDLEKEFDVLVFPDNNKDILLSGKYKRGGSYYVSSYPPEYVKGMGKEGLEKIFKYVSKGGNVVAWRGATELFMGPQRIKWSEDETEDFQLPVRDISDNLDKQDMYIPGSLLKIDLKQNHPLTYGMPESIGVFHRGSPVYSTSLPGFDMDRRVIGTFDEEQILLSGYARNGDHLKKKSAFVWLEKGEGQLIFFSFNPQFRSSTPVSYKLLFNALLLD